MLNEMKKVLVVDDDEGTRESLAEFFSDLGKQVFKASDGEKAQAVLVSNVDVSLVVTDFRMPKLDGVALLDWCRSSGYLMPIILMTAETHHLKSKKLTLYDSKNFLFHKPFNMSTLIKFLKAVEKADHKSSIDKNYQKV